ncbi:DUF2065 domain-containing protein [Donghicola tyrosinivorans]|uniref:DUF2065 domain-containing protein n=1 Tax=Donghicola tyrosinivorans TaxID=1652492 RepID=A0A2T0X501_9RHOB|nr:hypothetical protein CLV74_101137 [Donghicola tyrosinivorans]
MIDFVILAVGLVLITEGLAYALAPSFIERMLEALRQLSLEDRRFIGLICLAIGVVLVWIAGDVLPH